MVTVRQCCTSKQDKFSNSFSLKQKVFKKLKNLLFTSKQFWISIILKSELGSSWRLNSGGKQPIQILHFRYSLSASFERGNFSAVPCVGLAWPRAASSQKPVFFFSLSRNTCSGLQQVWPEYHLAFQNLRSNEPRNRSRYRIWDCVCSPRVK